MASDQSPPVTITPYPDGPYLVRGEFVVRDQDGKELPTERRTIALCRCGKSRIRPLCDGTHKLIRFQAPSGLEGGREPELRYRADGSGNGSNGRRK
jgi:CDGSH-type Zn-finger protein